MKAQWSIGWKWHRREFKHSLYWVFVCIRRARDGRTFWRQRRSKYRCLQERENTFGRLHNRIEEVDGRSFSVHISLQCDHPAQGPWTCNGTQKLHKVMAIQSAQRAARRTGITSSGPLAVIQEDTLAAQLHAKHTKMGPLRVAIVRRMRVLFLAAGICAILIM